MIRRSLCAALLLAMTSCSWFVTTEARTDAVTEAIELIVTRHDNYVRSDELLEDSQSAGFLAESRALLGLTVTGQEFIPITSLRVASRSVLARYDSYVEADPTLTEWRRGLWLTTSANLRAITERD